MYILSADFGTSSVKIAVIDENIQLLKTARRDYQYKISECNEVEIDIDELENAFLEALSDVKEYLPLIGAISFDAFAPSFIMMDKDGNALHPIVTHLDRRSRDYTKVIIDAFGKDVYREITGTLPHSGGVTLTTLLWFKDHKPDLFKKIYKIGHLTTYLYKRLTGSWGIDVVNASITGMYETVSEKGWSKYICETVGVPMEILPPIKELGTEYARLLPEMAEKMGIKKDIPVVLGTQDVASALIGADAKISGQTLCISGSSEMISILTDIPVTNDKYYLRASGIKGLWQVFSITTAGFALEWFRSEFYKDMSKYDFFNQYLYELLLNRFQTNGVQFLPFLTGDRQSLKKKKGSFLELTLKTTRDDMLCSLIEGIQKQSKSTFDHCEKIIKIKSPMKATGNLVENSSYLNIKKQLFDHVDIEVIANCPLKGNAIVVIKLLDQKNGELREESALCQ